MKQQNYADHEMTTATKVLGFESSNPQQTFNYPVTEAFISFIPSNAKQFMGLITQSGPISGPVLIPMSGTTNQIGEVEVSVRNDAGDFYIKFADDTFATGTLYVFPGTTTGTSSPTILQMGLDPFDSTNSKILVKNFDLLTQLNVDGINSSLHLIYVP